MNDLIKLMSKVMNEHRALWVTDVKGMVDCSCDHWTAQIDQKTGGHITAEYHRFHVAEELLKMLGVPQLNWAHSYKGYSGNWSLPVPAPTKERAEQDAADFLKVFGGKVADANSMVLWQAIIVTDWFEKEAS